MVRTSHIKTPAVILCIGVVFLRFEPVYYKYLHEIDGQARKNIAKAVLDQIVQCVLAETFNGPGNTENEKRASEDLNGG